MGTSDTCVAGKSGGKGGKVLLRLYVAGATARSRQALLRARQLCEAAFGCAYMLEVIDIFQQPVLAQQGHILATPTLVRESPPPLRRFIGNLADTACLFGAPEPSPAGRVKS